MKKLNKTAILAILFLILGIVVSISSGSTNALHFDPHDPIEIIGNSEFIEYAQNESLTGDGSQQTPYILQGLALTDIAIRDTDLYFEIKDNQISTAEDFGITFDNVSHGTISGNTVKDCYKGISLDGSSNNSVTNNIVSENDIVGILMLKSHNNTVTGNTISKNGGTTHVGARICGLYMETSHDNVVTNNIIDENALTGLNLPLSNYNLISENTISNHRYSGIDMAGGVGMSWDYMWGDNNIVTKNELYQNKWGIGIRGKSNSISSNKIFKNSIGIYVGLDNFQISIGLLEIFTLQSGAVNTEIVSNEIYNNSKGIVFERSTDGSTLKNSIYHNSGYGLSIKSTSSGTNIKQNDFIANNLEGTSQALDNGTDNTFLENYWYEWTSPDSDENTFVDEPYAIDGSTSNTDTSPADIFNANSPTDILPPQPKSTPGWAFSLLLLSIISMMIVRKRN